MKRTLTDRETVLLCKFCQCDAKRKFAVADSSTQLTLERLAETIHERMEDTPIQELIRQDIIQYMIVVMCQMLKVLDETDCDFLNDEREKEHGLRN